MTRIIHGATLERDVGSYNGIPIWRTNLVEPGSVVVLNSDSGQMIWMHSRTFDEMFPPPLWSRYTIGNRELERDRRLRV